MGGRYGLFSGEEPSMEPNSFSSPSRSSSLKLGAGWPSACASWVRRCLKRGREITSQRHAGDELVK